MKILYIIIILAVIYGALSIGTIVKNGVSLSEAPGIKQRLRIFLSTHRAATALDHAFPELITPVFSTSIATMTQALTTVTTELGWLTADATSPTDKTEHEGKHHYIVATALLNFKDDVTVTLEERGAQVALHIVAESRVGRADFGANIAHIKSLVSRLEKQLATP